METDKLVDVVKNYQQYGYDISVRNSAISVLKERGLKEEDLIFHGQNKARSQQHARDIIKDYSRNSLLALVFYLVIIGINFLPASVGLSLVAYLIAFLAFIGFLIASTMNLTRFFKAIGKPDNSSEIILYIALGIPFFIFVYFYFRSKMNEELDRIN